MFFFFFFTVTQAKASNETLFVLSHILHIKQTTYSRIFFQWCRASRLNPFRLWILLSHFLNLDLPKIALTGDINGLLLASFWLLQIFGSKRGKELETEGKKKGIIWKSSAHHFSQEIASLFDSLPESLPPIETALQMLLLYADYKEGALYEKNIYFGP